MPQLPPGLATHPANDPSARLLQDYRVVPPAGPSDPLDFESAASGGDRLREFTQAHLNVIVIVGIVALVAAAVYLTRARSETVPIEVAPVSVSEATPVPSAATLLVHVTGAVQTPGVVTLPVGARVQDAIAAAGGLSPDAELGTLNLAAVLSDGTQVVVGHLGELSSLGAGGASGGTAGGAVNLNTADATQLETLPGVGPVTAAKIIDWRTSNGRFTTVEELLEVDGIGQKTFAQLVDHVTV